MGSSPTGNVAFYASTTLLGTSALNASFQASLTTSSLAIGSYNITAQYLGNATNASSTSNVLSIAVTSNLPAAPANLLATPNNNRVGLTWSVSTGATGYRVKRSLTNGGPYTVIATPSAASCTDLTNSNGTTYYYVVSAYNDNGETTDSNQVIAIPSITATTPTTTILASSPTSTGVYGTTVTFTATVTASGAGPTGTVTFKDGGTTATLSGGTLSGVIGGDTVAIVSGSGTFASANIGTWAVTTAGYSLGGATEGNYTLTGFTGAVTITPKNLSASGPALSSRNYDGTTTSAGTPMIAPSLAAGDTTTALSQSFQTPDASGTVGGVVFVITPDTDPVFINVRAEFPASAASSSGRIFSRLYSTGN